MKWNSNLPTHWTRLPGVRVSWNFVETGTAEKAWVSLTLASCGLRGTTDGNLESKAGKVSSPVD